jgi:hypothetical protein
MIQIKSLATGELCSWDSNDAIPAGWEPVYSVTATGTAASGFPWWILIVIGGLWLVSK